MLGGMEGTNRVGTRNLHVTIRGYGANLQESSSGLMASRKRIENQVSTVLICGNTKVLTPSMLRLAHTAYEVVVTGELSFEMSQKPGNISQYNILPMEEKFDQLFEGYTVDVVWFIGSSADSDHEMHDELQQMKSVVDVCNRHGVPKIVVLSSMISQSFTATFDTNGIITGKNFNNTDAYYAGQLEDMWYSMASAAGIKVIILRLPYLADSRTDNNALGKIFDNMRTGQAVTLPVDLNTPVDFLSKDDLVDLLIHVSDETMDSSAMYDVNSGFPHTWQELTDGLTELKPDTIFERDEKAVIPTVTQYTGEMKRKYGFIAIDNVLGDLPAYYEAYEARAHGEKKKSLFERIMGFIEKRAMQYIELIGFFILMQLYVLFVEDNSAYFKYIDIRLFYVLLMGSTHGTMMGVFAGILASVSTLFSYIQSGTTGTMVFYNIEYWFPFAIYLMTGAITGYMHTSQERKAEFVEEENKLLRDKYAFLHQVYNSLVQNKGSYRRQILGYEDSFGKIYEAVRKLDSMEPSEIFMQGVLTMEQILDNHSIAIYTLDSYQRFARLVASSGEIMDELAKSLSMEQYAPVYETVKAGKLWKNTEFVKDMPAYAYGMTQGTNVRVVIVFWKADSEQMSLYYSNLFEILGNLVRLSFMRAVDYQDVVEDENYIPGTNVYREAPFRELVDIQEQMAANGVATYTLVRFDSTDPKTVDRALRGKIRGADLLGQGSDGYLYLVLKQTSGSAFDIVAKRLEQTGLEYHIVEEM